MREDVGCIRVGAKGKARRVMIARVVRRAMAERATGVRGESSWNCLLRPLMKDSLYVFRPTNTSRRPPPHLHPHGEGESCGHDHGHAKRRAKPNAYEIDPQEKKRKKALKKAQLAAAREAEAKRKEAGERKIEESPGRDEYSEH